MDTDWTRRRFLQASAGAAVTLAFASGCRRSGLAFDEYWGLDGLDLAARVKIGEVSPSELLELAIARAEAVDPKLGVITVPHFDLARGFAEGELPDGSFRGVPFLLKDLGVGMSGTITTEGSRFFQDALHVHDSTIVKRFREAGLVIFGKTHSPEFGSSPSSESILHGETHNPWDLTRSAGGSSGGSAAAVAAGIVPVAHATDGGGSIRIPASACGLFGLKPTRGRTPMGPEVYEGWGGLSSGHIVSRSVRDSAAMLDAVQGPSVGDAYATSSRARPFLEEVATPPGALRIALMRTPMIPVPVDADCQNAVESVARLCESLGHHVEEARPRLDVEALWNAFGQTTSVGVALKVARREAALGRAAGPEDLEPINQINVANGRKVTGLEHAAARDTLHAASRAIGQFMTDYDVILSPTSAAIAPKLGALSLSQSYESFVGAASAASAFTGLFNMTGQPAMSVPLETSAEGLPTGVMFAGRFGDEATLFRLAGQLEAAAPWGDRRPQL